MYVIRTVQQLLSHQVSNNISDQNKLLLHEDKHHLEIKHRVIGVDNTTAKTRTQLWSIRHLGPQINID